MSGWVSGAVAVIGALALLTAWRSHRELDRWLGRDPSGARRAARAALLAVVAALVGWALVRAAAEPPRLSGHGADVVLAVDVSLSMGARDAPPTRLRRALRLAERVALEAQSTRLALVAYAGDAFVALPLSQDRNAVITYLEALDSDVITSLGTDIARALDVAGEVFDPRSRRPRRVLLFSDGEHVGGSLEDALGRLRSLGVEVLSIGFGTTDGAAVPGQGSEFLRGDDGRRVYSRRADATLRRIAAATGGSYLRDLEDHPSPARLLPSAKEIAAHQTKEEAGPAARLIEALALLAGALLALEILLSTADLREWLPGRAAPLALAALAATLLGGGPWSWQRDGDALLEQGKAREALSLYRKAERHGGSDPSSRIRIGNALFRLGRFDKAAGAYLTAMRQVRPQDSEARFAASFNLGTALLMRERFDEARDAFWAAMVEDPNSLEAKFNYEWALERLEPEQEIPAPPSPQPQQSEEREAETEQSRSERSAQRREVRDPDSLDEAQAERWLRSIEEKLAEPLRRQVARSLAEGQSSARGPTW